MNLREGTRRLALLLGVVGAILGGVVSYLQLQSLMRQRADHRQFEQLANSGLVQEAKSWITLAPEQRDKALDQMTPEHKSQLAKALGFNGTPKFDPNAPYEPIDKWAQYEVKPPDPYEKYGGHEIADPNGTAPSEIDKDGIKVIHWTKDYSVESIETEDGQTLYPTPAPSAWLYLLIALFPVLGLFIPWGAVRAIGWVGAGFVASPK
jgi:hypothetical protein